MSKRYSIKLGPLSTVIEFYTSNARTDRMKISGVHFCIRFFWTVMDYYKD